MIKNRLAYLNAKRAGGATVILQGDVPRAGGQPWQKLCTLGYDYVLGNGSTPGRVQYRRPGQEEPKPDYSRGPMPGMPMPGGSFVGGPGGTFQGFEGMSPINTIEPAKPEADAAIVATLASMGFSENGAKRSALAVSNRSADEAMNWAMSHMEDANFNSALDGEGDAKEEVRCYAFFLVCFKRVFMLKLMDLIGEERDDHAGPEHCVSADCDGLC